MYAVSVYPWNSYKIHFAIIAAVESYATFLRKLHGLNVRDWKVRTNVRRTTRKLARVGREIFAFSGTPLGRTNGSCGETFEDFVIVSRPFRNAQPRNRLNVRYLWLTDDVFEYQVPSDDERDEFADADVTVDVSRPGLWDSRRELGVAQTCRRKKKAVV